MKNIRIFYLKICHFLVVKFSVYLNRRVFIMKAAGFVANSVDPDQMPQNAATDLCHR